MLKKFSGKVIQRDEKDLFGDYQGLYLHIDEGQEFKLLSYNPVAQTTYENSWYHSKSDFLTYLDKMVVIEGSESNNMIKVTSIKLKQ